MAAAARSRARRVLFLVAAALALFAGGAWWLLGDLPGPEALTARSSPDSSKLYDRHGTMLFEVLDPLAGRRTRVALEDLPLHLRQAVIAVEDAGFYRHPGVDARGLARALWQMLRERRVVSGGSTITQQLARRLLLSREEAASRSVRRKLREMVLALRITAAYPKDQILAFYLSEVYFGQLAYGAEAAARAYFGKPARELDLAEAAMLAGLIQSPARTNPLVDIDAARARQTVVLGLMVKAGFIDRAAADLARREPLRFQPAEGLEAAPHFVTWVLARLEEEWGSEALRRGGLQVLTSLDLNLQRRAEAVVSRRIAELQRRVPGKPDHRVSDAALVLLDPHSGQVLAMVGSADYHDPSIDGAVNVALALRQPGSAFKPFTYAAAFTPHFQAPAPPPPADSEAASSGSIPLPSLPFTPATVLSDVPTSFNTRENEPYRPQNYDRKWHGPISLRRALATSSNLVAVKVLDAVGIDAALDLAQVLGIRSLADRMRYGLALTLGGGDVRLLELTAAYGALANGGHRVTPLPVLEVLDAAAWREAAAGDRAGLAPYRQERRISAAPVLDPRVAFLITDILADDRARLPAFGEGSVLNLGRPAAAKTGTTTDFRDNWTLGYTPDLVAGVWLGNADNSPMEHISGITGAGPIWHDIMQEALRGRPAMDFPRPAGLVRLEVCTAAGQLPTADCPHRAREWFIAGTEPRRPDPSYVAIAVDSASGAAWDEACSGSQARRVFRLLPPDAADWGRAQGIPEPPRRSCRGERVTFAWDADRAPPPPSPRTGDRRSPLHPSPLHPSPLHPSPLHPSPLPPSPLPPSPLHPSPLHPSPLPPSPVTLLQPAPNSSFALSPRIPAGQQRIALVAQAEGIADLAELTISVDGVVVATLHRPPFRASWPLVPGAHEAQAVARTVDGRRIQSIPVPFTVLNEVGGR